MIVIKRRIIITKTFLLSLHDLIEDLPLLLSSFIFIYRTPEE